MRTMIATIGMAALVLAIQTGQLRAKNSDRDKTGTEGFGKRALNQQTAEKQEPAEAGSFETEGVRFELTNAFRHLRFSRPDSDSRNSDNSKDLEKDDSSACSPACSGMREEAAKTDAELQAVVSAWPTLPEAIRRGILAMVEAAS